MRHTTLWLIGFLLIGFTPVFAQNLFTNTNQQAAYISQTRTNTGEPGKNYWQNHGDYDMKIQFNPATNLLTGEETITYYNNSPDSLKKFIIRLYPDLYKRGVERGTLFGAIKDIDLTDGVTIDLLKIGDELIPVNDSNKQVHHSNTLLIVKPTNALLPKTEVNLTIKWHYTVNTGSQIRTGRVDSSSYFIAYFFPRIAVYDDIDGWDTWSYNGTQEFYNDFGNYNVELDLPKQYAVWATGERLNAADNFSKTVLDRIAQASISDSIIHVIDSTDYIKHDVFTAKPTGIWKFNASNVTDFVFAISDHYLWDASSVLVDSVTKRRTLTSAVYNKLHTDYYDVANQAHQSVYYMSFFYPKVPFPFPSETVFDGTDQMEYPMMVNDNPTATHKDAVQLTSHEIFHSYFPFYMGINETQYGWMDEGWATIGESVISPKMGEPEDEGIFSKTRFEHIAGTDRDVPLITNTKLYDGDPYLANIYGKAAVCYYVLQDMLGDSLYFKGLHTYMDNWHSKHPTPYDFFYSFNTGTGRDLNWFWHKWFYELVYPDLAITSVKQNKGMAMITITNKGGLPLPVNLTITMDDGTIKYIHYGAVIWDMDSKKFTVIEDVTGKIKSIQLGDDFTPDTFKKDNTWQ